MKLDSISMDREQAKQAYLDYRAAARANGSPEDAMLATGYRELAMGHSLIQLSEAMKKGGIGNDGFPRLAIGRADGERVRCTLDRTSIESDGPRGTIRYRTMGHAATTPKTREFSDRRTLLYEDLTLSDFPGARWPADTMNKEIYKDARAETILPNIPAALRPSHALKNYHVFFEVEKWTPVIDKPRPSRDPALLRHIGGDLYAVLAVWDLTELERAVIAGTRLA